MTKFLNFSPMRCAGLLLAAVAIMSATLPSADAALRNRYSFTTDATDSISGANGTPITANAGTVTFAGGTAVLSGGGAGDSFIDLPDGLASSASSGGTSGEISVETWVTANQLDNWAVLFSFGNSGPDAEDNNGGDGDYWQLIPQSGPGPFRSTTHLGDPGGETFADTTTLATGTLQHVANVLNVANNTNELYVNGALAATAAIHPGFNPNTFENPTTMVGDTQNWLGRSQWGDPSFNGSYDEFRVYDHALTPKEVLANDLNGPDVYDPNADLLSVLVDPTNGQIEITNNVGVALDIDYYEIRSPAGALNPAGWNSFADNDGSAPGVGWDESGGSNPSQLIELFLGDPNGPQSDPFAANSTRSLGAAFQAGNAARDLTFGFQIEGSAALIPGTVSYGTIGNVINGDYDDDGLVGQGDLDLVLLNWGDTAPPVPGGWVNQQPTGLIGQTQLDGVLLNWGNTSLSSAVANVPEPAALSMLCLGAGLLSLRRRRS